MLPKKQRFSFRSSLPRQTFNSQSFSVRYDKNSPGLKIAVVVSKRIDKRAAVRNRIKRRILESVQDNIKETDSLSLVLYVKKGILEAQDLKKEISKMFELIKYV